ncbi:MAG: EamA family transporter [Oscillospiraceae bacterium]|nr:EamA family transporter [Oscillospiraceae bacterium]
MSMYIPVFIVVLSNTFYHICAKSIPEEINPFAALSVTYLVGAAACLVLFFVTQSSHNLFAEYRHLNWSSFVLGIAIVGLEAGFIYMYKLGWNVSTGQLVASTLLAIVLIFVGWLIYHEILTAEKIIGILICMVGLYFINK